MYNFYNMTSETVEALKKEAYLQGWKDGRASQGRREAYNQGRIAGFQAGFAAAQAQPAAKIEAAYEQGVADATKLVPVRKNGVGY